MAPKDRTRPKTQAQVQKPAASTKMMRVAVAGTGGLALSIAYWLMEEATHQLLLLSRSEKPQLAEEYDVEVVDYDDAGSLQHALLGVDTVISTVTGDAQLNLINAAVQCHVRRFMPAEFEGSISRRPVDSQSDPLDRGKGAALQRLEFYRGSIESTVFTCGVFYERFAPHGLAGAGLGIGSGIAGEGAYMVNLRNMMGAAPIYDPLNNLVYICMTSAQDVARFVVRCLDLDEWPRELRMCGERVSVWDLLATIQEVRGPFETGNIAYLTMNDLTTELTLAQHQGDILRLLRTHHLIATVQGRYDFTHPNLTPQIFGVPTEPFRQWLSRTWVGQ
ncbi:isoflavone reductase family protein [Patellaria atrata CBS 101060]|uniref:Isoflavone reductase family protein n=1 Tax=Patellaria atrata CBS 101060 TaxID=1346257 RepID=A0A9P4SAY1_9PEZI|nr:isoflavone reductase family protein [Patellaria atrata CBS 101060]